MSPFSIYGEGKIIWSLISVFGSVPSSVPQVEGLSVIVNSIVPPSTISECLINVFSKDLPLSLALSM